MAMGSHVDLRRVVSVGSLKDPSLYFESVFPFDFSQSLLDHVSGNTSKFEDAVPFKDGKWDEDVINSLLPDTNNPIKSYLEYCTLVLIFSSVNACIDNPDYVDEFLDVEDGPIGGQYFSDRGFDARKIFNSIKRGRFDEIDFQKKLSAATMKIFEETGFNEAPIWSSIPKSGKFSSDAKNDASRFMASLKGLNLIDVEKISWPKIVEFRKDKESRDALT